METDHESNHGKGDGRHRERETESFSEREHEKILASLVIKVHIEKERLRK